MAAHSANSNRGRDKRAPSDNSRKQGRDCATMLPLALVSAEWALCGGVAKHSCDQQSTIGTSLHAVIVGSVSHYSKSRVMLSPFGIRFIRFKNNGPYPLFPTIQIHMNVIHVSNHMSYDISINMRYNGRRSAGRAEGLSHPFRLI